ncbi:alpha/beta fold hydrolase [Pseudonocardia sichuanensis]
MPADRAAPTVTHAEFPEGRIAYRLLGDTGPPVVLLHGGGLDNGTLTWGRLARELAVDHRVHSPDLPKHGGSWPWRALADQRALEDLVPRLLDHWGLRSATLIGLSLGATTAIGAALRHPERVDRLVLTSSGGIQDRVPGAGRHELAWLALRTPLSRLITRTQTAATLARHVRDFPFADDVPAEERERLVAGVVAEHRAKRDGHMFSDWNRVEIGFRRMRTDHRPELHRIARPTLVLHGDADTVVPVRYAREAASLIPGARLVVVEGASHSAPMDHPTEVGAAIREFLDGTRDAVPGG